MNVVGHTLAGAVMVDDDFLEVGVGRHLGEILFGSIDRVEGVVVPDVPAYSQGRLHRFDFVVDGFLGFSQAGGPE